MVFNQYFLYFIFIFLNGFLLVKEGFKFIGCVNVESCLIINNILKQIDLLSYAILLFIFLNLHQSISLVILWTTLTPLTFEQWIISCIQFFWIITRTFNQWVWDISTTCSHIQWKDTVFVLSFLLWSIWSILCETWVVLFVVFDYWLILNKL